MTLTKQGVIDEIHARSDLSITQSRNLLESLLELLKATLSRGESIMISGFGRFQVRQKAARLCRNPHTGESILLRSRKVLVFKTSRVLKDKIN